MDVVILIAAMLSACAAMAAFMLSIGLGEGRIKALILVHGGIVALFALFWCGVLIGKGM